MRRQSDARSSLVQRLIAVDRMGWAISNMITVVIKEIRPCRATDKP